MMGTDEAGPTGLWLRRRIIPGLPALATMGVGFGLAVSAKAGVWEGDSWSFWLSLAAAPILVGLGGAWFLARRDRVRRESAWDIFVERELERETHKPPVSEHTDFVKVGTLVDAPPQKVRRRRKKHARRSTTAQTGA